jgi:hypothetical protein
MWKLIFCLTFSTSLLAGDLSDFEMPQGMAEALERVKVHTETQEIVMKMFGSDHKVNCFYLGSLKGLPEAELKERLIKHLKFMGSNPTGSASQRMLAFYDATINASEREMFTKVLSEVKTEIDKVTPGVHFYGIGEKSQTGIKAVTGLSGQEIYLYEGLPDATTSSSDKLRPTGRGIVLSEPIMWVRDVQDYSSRQNGLAFGGFSILSGGERDLRLGIEFLFSVYPMPQYRMPNALMFLTLHLGREPWAANGNLAAYQLALLLHRFPELYTEAGNFDVVVVNQNGQELTLKEYFKGPEGLDLLEFAKGEAGPESVDAGEAQEALASEKIEKILLTELEKFEARQTGELATLKSLLKFRPHLLSEGQGLIRYNERTMELIKGSSFYKTIKANRRGLRR